MVAHLESANLTGAHLEGANLNGAHLQDADLAVAHLQGANLGDANLQGVDLYQTHLEGVYIADARLHVTRLRRQQIKQVGEEKDRNYEDARRAYLGLKVNFREIGYYDDARWAYLKERRMERKSHPWHSPYWLLSWIEDIFTGYDEKPQWIMSRLFPTIWLLFALLYWAGQGLGPVESYLSLRGVHTYLLFSLRAMVTLENSPFPLTEVGLWLSAFEGALGIIAFGLLGFSVAKRIARD